MNEKELYIERLNALLNLLYANGMTPWLMCGTLLAFIREGKPFEHDYRDIDIALPKEDYWKFRKLIDNHPDFSYYRVWRREIAVLYKLCAKIDVFFLNPKSEEKLYVYSYKPNSFTGKWDSEWRTIFESKDFYPLILQDYPFISNKIYIPMNAENILSTHYGDWQIPNSKWTINEMTNVDNNYRQLAFIVPDNIENKNRCVKSIRNLFPENWYRIYSNIEESQNEPFLIILNNNYVFDKFLDINAMIQVLLSKEEIGAVNNRIEKELNISNPFTTFISRTQKEQTYIYDDSDSDFLLVKREAVNNLFNYKIAKLYEVKDEE